MSINREKWTQAREDYIRGRGSLRTLAGKHGLKCGSVEKCAKREGWTRLRGDYEAAQLAKLIPSAPPVLPPAPVAPDGTISDQWLAQRVELYYRENAGLVDKARSLLAKKLADDGSDLGTDGLAKLTSALGGIVDAENKLLGLNHRQNAKQRRPQRGLNPIPLEPTPVAGPVTTTNTNEPSN